jgi:hypothetical protein
MHEKIILLPELSAEEFQVDGTQAVETLRYFHNKRLCVKRGLKTLVLSPLFTQRRLL